MQAVAALQHRLGGIYADVEFIQGGTRGYDLLPIVEAASHLLVLDAVNAGQKPGTLVEFTRDEIAIFGGARMSMQRSGFQDVLTLASLRGTLPRYLYVLGIQPADLSVGNDLSPEVRARFPDILARAEFLLQEWARPLGSG